MSAICDKRVRSGDSPLLTQKTLLSIIDAIGIQLKTSVKLFQILMLYLRLPRKRLTKVHKQENTFVIESIDSIDRSYLMIAS